MSFDGLKKRPSVPDIYGTYCLYHHYEAHQSITGWLRLKPPTVVFLQRKPVDSNESRNIRCYSLSPSGDGSRCFYCIHRVCSPAPCLFVLSGTRNSPHKHAHLFVPSFTSQASAFVFSRNLFGTPWDVSADASWRKRAGSISHFTVAGSNATRKAGKSRTLMISPNSSRRTSFGARKKKKRGRDKRLPGEEGGLCVRSQQPLDYYLLVNQPMIQLRSGESQAISARQDLSSNCSHGTRSSNCAAALNPTRSLQIFPTLHLSRPRYLSVVYS